MEDFWFVHLYNEMKLINSYTENEIHKKNMDSTPKEVHTSILMRAAEIKD